MEDMDKSTGVKSEEGINYGGKKKEQGKTPQQCEIVL